jgi:IS30 family transposase
MPTFTARSERDAQSFGFVPVLAGSHSSQIATLVERQTRYVMLVKVASKDAETFTSTLIKNAR